MATDAAIQSVPITPALAVEQRKFVVLRTAEGTRSAGVSQHTTMSDEFEETASELSDAGDWLVFRDAIVDEATSSSSHSVSSHGSRSR